MQLGSLSFFLCLILSTCLSLDVTKFTELIKIPFELLGTEAAGRLVVVPENWILRMDSGYPTPMLRPPAFQVLLCVVCVVSVGFLRS